MQDERSNESRNRAYGNKLQHVQLIGFSFDRTAIRLDIEPGTTDQSIDTIDRRRSIYIARNVRSKQAYEVSSELLELGRSYELINNDKV